jgi:hypothetical protein
VEIHGQCEHSGDPSGTLRGPFGDPSGTLRGPFGDPSGRTLRLERVTGCDVTLMEPLEHLEAKNFDENPKKIIKILNLHMLYTMKHNIQYTDIE